MWMWRVCVGGLLAALPVAGGAAPRTERFRASVRGALSIAGNTLGLSKVPNQNGPGTSDGIGGLFGRAVRG